MLVKYLWKFAEVLSVILMFISLVIIFFSTDWWAIIFLGASLLFGYLIQRFAPTYLW